MNYKLLAKSTNWFNYVSHINNLKFKISSKNISLVEKNNLLKILNEKQNTIWIYQHLMKNYF